MASPLEKISNQELRFRILDNETLWKARKPRYCADPACNLELRPLKSESPRQFFAREHCSVACSINHFEIHGYLNFRELPAEGKEELANAIRVTTQGEHIIPKNPKGKGAKNPQIIYEKKPRD